MTSTLQELRERWKAYLDEPFPHVAEDDTAHQFEAELAEYDAYFGGLIESVIAGEPVDPNLLKSKKYIEEALDKLKSRLGDSREDLRKYQSYLADLVVLIVLARKVAQR